MKTLWALRKEFPVTGDVEMAFTTIQFLKIVCWHTCELIDNMKFSKPCGHTLVTGTSMINWNLFSKCSLNRSKIKHKEVKNIPRHNLKSNFLQVAWDEWAGESNFSSLLAKFDNKNLCPRTHFPTGKSLRTKDSWGKPYQYPGQQLDEAWNGM